MKKAVLLVLCFVYVFIQIIISNLSNQYVQTYTIDGDHKFSIKEVKIRENDKNEFYYFEISENSKTFLFKMYSSLKSTKKKIIKDIKYFEDEQYICLLPITEENTIFSDMMCLNNNIVYPYHSIKGNDLKLDEYVKSISLYDSKRYTENDEILKKENSIVLYKNIPNNIFLSFEYYKGIFYTNNKNSLIKKQLFKNDVYTKNISAYVKNYYFTANYDETYEFHNFYLINLINGKKVKIVSNEPISMYSYINGVVDDCIYMVDEANKKQYKIDTKIKKIIEVGNSKLGFQYYNNGTWETMNNYENEIIFNNYHVDFNKNEYDKVDEYREDNVDYYYLYKKVGNKYEVYRINATFMDNPLYLFTTSTIENIIYIKDYIFYKEDNYIKFYHDLTGNQKIVKMNEMKFNNTIKFYLYEN